MLTKIFHKNTTSSCEFSNNLDYYLTVFNHFFFMKNYKMKNLLIQGLIIIVILILTYYLIDFLANI